MATIPLDPMETPLERNIFDEMEGEGVFTSSRADNMDTIPPATLFRSKPLGALAAFAASKNTADETPSVSLSTPIVKGGALRARGVGRHASEEQKRKAWDVYNASLTHMGLPETILDHFPEKIIQHLVCPSSVGNLNAAEIQTLNQAYGVLCEAMHWALPPTKILGGNSTLRQRLFTYIDANAPQGQMPKPRYKATKPTDDEISGLKTILEKTQALIIKGNYGNAKKILDTIAGVIPNSGCEMVYARQLADMEQ